MIQIHGTPKELQDFVWTMAIAHEITTRYEVQKGSKSYNPVKERLEHFAKQATLGIEEMEEMKKEQKPDIFNEIYYGDIEK